MDHQIISQYILDRLSAAGNREDLIRDVCLREGIQWPEAEALVNQVEAEDEKIILRRQSPIDLTNAFMYVLAGMLITAFSAYVLFWPAVESGNFSLPIIFSLFRYGYQMALLLLIGLTLAIGGMIAFFNTLFQLFRK
ncbi:MAG: hypothetical protein ABSC61_11970 [Anaerolineales bacterium]